MLGGGSVCLLVKSTCRTHLYLPPGLVATKTGSRKLMPLPQYSTAEVCGAAALGRTLSNGPLQLGPFWVTNLAKMPHPAKKLCH
eukprot:5289250-Amphidinium_carterae.1